jgi:ABC-type polysaccharide/polyol phosphate transport system ATPase subunit
VTVAEAKSDAASGVKSGAANGAKPAIRAEHVTKVYRLYDRPSDRVKEFLTGGKLVRHREVRGLDDVSFEVPHGLTLGIVGSNGAGKSTLLKVLSGTTMPTSGTFELSGKVASLLELGAGFYPGFTGRQNIFLNGIVNGYTRKEIAARYDDVVAFAELGDFIDQPIRTYSSGMVMRLGFSVATAVDPEVLIIDEILAVGDMHFQKRCIDRIVSFKNQGKTILFCSHSMYHVEEICDRAIWIKDGRIELEGESREVALAYSNYERGRRSTHTPRVVVGGAEPGEVGRGSDVVERGGDVSEPGREAHPVVLSVRLRDPHTNAVVERARLLKDVVVEIDYELPKDLPGLMVGMAIYRTDQLMICGLGSHLTGFKPPSQRGRWRVQITLQRLVLLAAEYTLVGYLGDERGLHIYHSQSLGTRFDVEQLTREVGVVHVDHTFTAQPLRWPTAAERAAELKSPRPPESPPAPDVSTPPRH